MCKNKNLIRFFICSFTKVLKINGLVVSSGQELQVKKLGGDG